MGFFDKIKNFVGGHGVSVFITELEGGSPKSVNFPLYDSVLKGRIEIHATKEATILNHGFRLTAILEDEGSFRSVIVAEETNDGEIMGSDVKWPYNTVPGEVVKDSFCMIRIDIADAMRRLGLEADAAVADPRVRLELKVWADVKGTPIDASAKQTILVVEGGTTNTYAEPVEETASGPREIPVRTQPLPLDPTPYLERFNQMVDELRANPKIEVLEYTVHPPATSEEIAAAQAYFPNIPAAMLDFYTQANGLRLKWKLVDEGEDRSEHGNIDLTPIQNVFSSWEGVMWFDEEWDEGRFKPLHPIDFFVPEACAAIFLDGNNEPKVYYHYCGEEMESMEVDFAGYLELLLKSRGYWYWQTAISTDLSGKEYTIEPREFRLNMPDLFSDFDVRFFLKNDHSAKDRQYVEEHTLEGQKLQAALKNAGVEYQTKDRYGLNIEVLDTAENLGRLQQAIQEVQPGKNIDGDWGAIQFGKYFIGRSSSL